MRLKEDQLVLIRAIVRNVGEQVITLEIEDSDGDYIFMTHNEAEKVCRADSIIAYQQLTR